MASAGYNVMYPYSWLATAGDSTGDSNFQVVNMPADGTLSGAPNAGGFSGGPVVGSWFPGSGMHTTAGPVDATYSGYVNAAIMQGNSQAPVVGTPALVNGNPNNGPVAVSDYADGTLPQQYLSPVPPWKSAPMQEAAAALPPNVQQAAATAAIGAGSAGQNTHAKGGGCSGCNGGCGGNKSRCQGRNPPLGLDSTNDFQPLYSHHTANAAQVVGAHLYSTTSTKHQAWTVSQGVPSDDEAPLQGQ